MRDESVGGFIGETTAQATGGVWGFIDTITIIRNYLGKLFALRNRTVDKRVSVDSLNVPLKIGSVETKVGVGTVVRHINPSNIDREIL